MPKFFQTTSRICKHIGHAQAAIQNGLCDVALITYGSTQRTISRSAASPREFNPYESAYKPFMPTSAYALAAWDQGEGAVEIDRELAAAPPYRADLLKRAPGQGSLGLAHVVLNRLLLRDGDPKLAALNRDDYDPATGDVWVAGNVTDEQIVAVERYTSGNTDVAPQIAGLQAKGADLVLGFNTPSYTALSQLVAMKLNYKPDWFYSSIGSDPALVGSLLSRFSEGAVKDGAGALDAALISCIPPGERPVSAIWRSDSAIQKSRSDSI